MYFAKKGTRSVQWGLGEAPEDGEFSRIFVLKVTLLLRFHCKVTFKCKLQKKLGEQDVLVAPPNNFVVGATAPRGANCSPCSPVSRAMAVNIARDRQTDRQTAVL